MGDGTPFSANMGSFAAAPPDSADLEFYAKTRDGNTFTDNFGNDATILTPCFLRVSDTAAAVLGNPTRSEEHLIDGNSYTCYFQLKQINDVTESGADDIVSLGGGRTSTRRGMEFRTWNGNLWFYISDGATQYSQSLVTDVNTNIKGQGVFDIFITINGTAEEVFCGVYNSAGALVGSSMTQDISAFVFNSDDNYQAIKFYSPTTIIENFKKFTALKTLVQCQTDTYRTDLQIHLPNVFAGADISGNAIDFSHLNIDATDIYYTDINAWILDYGYDWYQYGLDPDYVRTVPYDTDGNAYIPSREAAEPWVATRIVRQAEGSAKINAMDCAIRFTNSFFDRSNTTIWAAAARTGYYDASDPYFFHISELNQKTLYDWLNDGYRGRAYVHYSDNSIEQYDRKVLKEVFVYATDRQLTDNKEVLIYTGDLMSAVLDEQSEVTYDADDYVKLGTLMSAGPMLTIRFDDGFIDQFTEYKPFFDTYDISPLVGIHSAEVGTGNYATWETLLAAYKDDPAYDICCHNNYDNDYSTLAYVDIMEQDMIDGRDGQEAQGMTCDYHFGNRHSSSNPSIFYFSHKIGHKAHICASDYGEGRIHGANPRVLNLYRLCAMGVDINLPAGHPYYLVPQPNTTAIANIKAEMDNVVSENEWLIIFIHTHNQDVEDGLAECLDYWETTLGESFYSMSEALDNCKYL